MSTHYVKHRVIVGSNDQIMVVACREATMLINSKAWYFLHFKEEPTQHQKVFGTFLQIGQVYDKTGKFDDELAGTEDSERRARIKGDLTGLIRSSSSIPLRSQQVDY